MALHGKTILAVVPARGGSKGIPGKNLKTVGGLSLVAHAARSAREAGVCDAMVLSTDYEDIAAEGRRVGLDVPFLRPAELAGDNSTSLDMWRHAWTECERHYGKRFDISVLLQPTSPLRTGEHILAALAPLLSSEADSAMTLTPTPGHYTPHKAKLLAADGRVRSYLPPDQARDLRQDIPDMYFPNGYCYAVTREALLDQGLIITPDCLGIVIKHPVANIDDPWELEYAEFLWSRRQG